MDFASLMSSQISKASSPTASSAASTSTQKYLKRADLEAERQANYRREQEEAAAAREAKVKRKREREEEDAKRDAAREEKRRKLAEESRLRREREEAEQERRRRKRLGLPETPPQANEEKLSEPEETISEEDLTSRFRALKQPTTLFGETHASRLARFRSLTSTTKPLTPVPPSQNSSLPIPTTLSLLPETDIKVPVPAKLPTTSEAKLFLLRQLITYFTLLLREWNLSLSLRPQEVKDSFQGKQAYAAYSQSLTAMVPLFRKFEHPDTLLPNGGNNSGGGGGGIPDSILLPLISIVGAAQERRYVEANDGYLKLSIGKAAWPIGVTMVGIHERSAREKLHEGEGGKAHVMGDEVTRKYLQAIKRCVSFAQTRWPPEDLGQLMG